MPADSAFVPAHWHLEVGNTVLVHTRRARLLPADADRTIDALRSLPVTVDAETGSQALNATFLMAVKHALTLYDAAYLELALRLHLPLATFDKTLRRAADSAGVPLVNPPA
ncbi:MAG: type II toxin-antitoxin system VapC family toxin [Acetobacteraceae bacterium]